MLVNNLSSNSNIPNFTHSCQLENIFEEALLETVPEFLKGLTQLPTTANLNEVVFSQEFVTSLNRILIHNPKGILAVSEYTDIYTVGANPGKRVDIAFVSSTQGAFKIKLYTVEAKRLPTGTGNRETEYIYGHFNNGSPSGGIQRFKSGDHGFGLSKSALLGYVEKYNFFHWHTTINDWIIAKATELPDWNNNEQLQKLEISACGKYSISRSVADRLSDTIDLFHFWIKIP